MYSASILNDGRIFCQEAEQGCPVCSVSNTGSIVQALKIASFRHPQSGRRIVWPAHFSNALCKHLDQKSQYLVLAAGENLYDRLDSATSLMVVVSGALKLELGNNRIRSRVVDFHLPGSVLGDYDPECADPALKMTALNASAVFVLSRAQFVVLATNSPSLLKFRLKQQQFLQYRSYWSSLVLAQCNAAQRVAFLLLNLLAQLSFQGYSNTHMELPMSRTDMASHLNCSKETISRVLKDFAESGYLCIKSRRVWAINKSRLKDRLFPTKTFLDTT